MASTPTFTMRIVSMDYYMASPIPEVDICYNSFQGQVVQEVPVIRIYGSTLGGQKTCLHVHQAFPYLYVPYDNDLSQNIEEGYSYVRCLASAIEKAMKLNSGIGAKRQHVHSCSLVRAKKFYGYHSSEQLFIKIVLYHPEEVNRVAALLLGGGILNHVFQPHESHIPYLLQFLIDNNLYGMGHIHLSKLKFRDPLPDGICKRFSLFRDFASNLRVGRKDLDDLVVLNSESTFYGPEVEPVTPSPPEYLISCGKGGISNAAVEAYKNTDDVVIYHSELWVKSKVPREWLWSTSIPDFVGGSPSQGKHPYKRQSTCELEGDATVQEILNQHQLMFLSLSQAGPEVKMVRSLIQIWEEEYSRTGLHTSVEKFDDRKPSSGRVLKTLSPGQEYQNLLNLIAAEEHKKGFSNSCAFMFSKKEIAAQSRKEIQASPSGLNSVERHFPCERLSDASEQLVKCTQAANSRDFIADLQVTPSLRLSDAEDDRSMLIAGKQELNATDAFIDEDFVRSQMTKSNDLQDIDKEAVELLRWLASFQAASEDKEDEELVLSQLLRSDSIERVLERAHSNYEDVSQKECEDILDSMEDVEEDKSNHLCYTSGGIPEYVDHSSPEDVIPQLDGIWDDLVENPGPSKSKDRKARKNLNPFAKDSDKDSRDVATSSSSADEPTKNRTLWGSLPLASSERSQENLSTTENTLVHVSKVREDQYSENLGSVDEAKEPSLRDQMRKKRIRRPETLELEHLIPPRTMSKDTDNKKTENMSNDLHNSTSEKCNESRVSKDSVSIQPFELRDCSQKYGKKLVDNKVSRYGSLPLVNQSTSDHSLEACEELHGKQIKRNASKEETQAYLKSGTSGPNNDHETNERIALKKSVTYGSCRSIPLSKIVKEKAETGCQELQTCSDPMRGCSFQCNSDRGSWEEHVTSNTGEARQLCGDDVCGDINITEKLSQRRHSVGEIEKSFSECQACPKVEKLESEEEIFLHGCGKKLQLSEKDDSSAIRIAARELQSLSQRNWLEDKLIPLVFHRQPPTKEQIQLGFLSGSIASLKSDGVYYGNVGDVPDAPVVIAGSLFEVKSRETKNLCPFFMEMEREGSLTDRKCMNKDLQGLRHGFETVVGIQMHYQNNGSVLYLLTPAQPPPSSSYVRRWLSQVQVKCLGDELEQQEIGIHSSSNYQTDNKQLQTLENTEATKKHMTGKQITGLSSCTDILKVASPNYDETCVHITGSENSSQHGKTSLQICQTGTTDTSGCGNLNSSSQGCNMIHSSNHKQCADGLHGKCQSVGAHHILKDLHFKDGNIPVSSPNQHLSYGKLQKETILEEYPKFWRDISQISAPSPVGTKQTSISQTGFRDPASVGAGQQLTLMSIEISAQSRGDLRPDPRYDAINIIVVVIQEDFNHAKEVFVFVRDEKANMYNRNIDGVLNCEVFAVNNEKTLFELFIQLVRLYDPDILMGWEIQGGSIGFLAERAAYIGIGLLKKISRTPFFETNLWAVCSKDVKRNESKESILEEIPPEALDLHDTIIEDEWGRTHGSGIHVGGRIVLNLWRIMRGELNLGIYTLEAVSEAVLKRKVPSFPWSTLTRWFSSGPGRGRFRCIEYVIDRAELNLAIMDQLDMINRTSELARVFGIDFFSVFSRGSQYRVESMMLRLAHTQNFLVVSPSKQQVASQPAMECLPLVMEPESMFYTDPVVVLDFQSLYPSMIIAYNLCFSTCLGKIMPGNSKILGVTSYTPDIHLSEIVEHLFITPNGVMYVPPEVCQGVLPRLLKEILSTRIMVKNVMKKLLPTQKVLQRVLNARQLALKLIANVTYGYTAAGFSGRMPCAEIADSIVQCGRKTLENAINFVNSNSEWNARVVYGDTDSMFVLLKGRTREEAFRIGQEIASAITATNPNPVTLKMEKVYHPCVLLTKKRYVGYSYESSTQSKPTFDAKGIETVRRDSCPAVAKILERCLRILFESRDLSEVKSYLYRQWTKILRGSVSLQDFIFAKEVRLGTYSTRASSLPPAAIVATKAMRIDPRAEPCYGERVRYVVVYGEPGARLVDMVIDPLELLHINTPHRLHDIYYITKQIIPALQRVFGLVGVDLKLWYSGMPRPVRPILAKRRPNISPSRSRHSTERYDAKKYQKGPLYRSTIDHYYLSQHCVVCGELIQGARFLCDRCSRNRCTAALTMTGRTARLEKEIQHLDAICRHCGGGDLSCEKGIKCISLDCPVFYERRKVQKELLVVSQVSTESGFYPSCMVELF